MHYKPEYFYNPFHYHLLDPRKDAFAPKGKIVLSKVVSIFTILVFYIGRDKRKGGMNEVIE